MVFRYGSDDITPSESTRHSWDEAKDAKDREYQLALADKNIQVALIENRWGAIMRVPLAIIRLPAYMIMAIGYCIAQVKGTAIDDRFWDFMQK